MIHKSSDSDIPTYFQSYFALIEGTDLIEELQASRKLTLDLLTTISVKKANYAYAKGKWTIMEVFRHIIDCERIYAYRALRFSRFDDSDLPGFNENEYITKIKHLHLDMDQMLIEYGSLRESNIQLFKSMNEKMLDFKGIVNGTKMNARAIGFMIVAHNLHHCKIIKERYFDPDS